MATDRSSFSARTIALAALALVLLALLVWRLEWVEEEVDLGPTEEARRNPFLASQRLLAQYDVPYYAQDGFVGLERMQWQGEPIGQHDTLILINTHHNLHEHQLEQIWQWVEAGGRLIVSVENPFIGSGQHLRDGLLERLELNLQPNYMLGIDANADDEADDSDDAPPPTTEDETAPDEESPRAQLCRFEYAVGAQLGTREPMLTISVSGEHHLSVHSDANEVLAGDTEAAYLVRRQVGTGEIYAITSVSGWRNSSIGCHDNAYLFWRLSGDSPAVRYAINQRTPSFWRYMWELSAVGCVALLLALAFWLWTQATRFGPIHNDAAPGRRQFTDHIRASGQFMLRHGGAEPLVAMLREELVQCLERRHRGFARLPRDEQMAIAQRLTGCDSRAVSVALHHSLSQSPFLHIVKRLQQLRNRL